MALAAIGYSPLALSSATGSSAGKTAPGTLGDESDQRPPQRSLDGSAVLDGGRRAPAPPAYPVESRGDRLTASSRPYAWHGREAPGTLNVPDELSALSPVISSAASKSLSGTLGDESEQQRQPQRPMEGSGALDGGRRPPAPLAPPAPPAYPAEARGDGRLTTSARPHTFQSLGREAPGALSVPEELSATSPALEGPHFRDSEPFPSPQSTLPSTPMGAHREPVGTPAESGVPTTTTTPRFMPCSLDLNGLGESSGGGIPRKEVERWCAQFACELQAASEAKLARIRAELDRRGRAIVWLYWRLQCMEPLTKEGGPACSPARSGEDAGQNSGSSPLISSFQGRAAGGGPLSTPLASPTLSTRGVVPSSEGAGIPRGGRAGSLPPAADSESLSPARSMPATEPHGGSTARVRPGYAAEDRVTRARRPTLEQMAGVPGSSPQPTASPLLSQPRKLRTRGDAPAEHSSTVHLRQENSQLKKQLADLNKQVRARDVQVDNLTGMIREMQAAAQRQRRQLIIREDTLQALQEEFLKAASSSAAAMAMAESNGLAAGRTTMSSAPGGSLGSRAVPAGMEVPSGRGAAPQAPRGSRRGVDGSFSERGSSITRSSSALARRKDQTAVRRTSFAPPLTTAASGQSLRAFSPRTLHQQTPLASLAPGPGQRERQPVGSPQLGPQVHQGLSQDVEPPRRISAVAPLPQGTSPSSPMGATRSLASAAGPVTVPRSSSVEVRARARSSMACTQRKKKTGSQDTEYRTVTATMPRRCLPPGTTP